MMERAPPSSPSAKLAHRSICPVCFQQYPPGEVAVDYPFCPDCASEAMDIEVEEFASFMTSKTITDFDVILDRWNQVEGMRPAYKEEKALRIRSLRDQKAREVT